MELMKRLIRVQDKVFREIGAAVRKEDSAEALALIPKFQEVTTMIRRLQDLDKQATTLESANTIAPPHTARLAAKEKADQPPAASESRKEWGRNQRETFVRTARERGIKLEPVKSKIYRRLPDALRVGIASAREASNKGRWFLGLRDNQFDHAILLCVSHDGELNHFSLPKEFIIQHGPSLSRELGQPEVKFNVFRREGLFFLHVSGQPPISIEPFRNNYFGLI